MPSCVVCSESEFVKVMHCESTKDIWDKLQNIYEGDDKVKKAKLQTHRRQFESLKMKDEENVASYLLVWMKLSTPSEDLVKRLKNQ
jgi:hypothetical protein